LTEPNSVNFSFGFSGITFSLIGSTSGIAFFSTFGASLIGGFFFLNIFGFAFLTPLIAFSISIFSSNSLYFSSFSFLLLFFLILLIS
jgi:phosphate/sulfate permease